MSVPLNNLLIMDTQIGMIYDADGGDGDGVPNPGESIEISVDIIKEKPIVKKILEIKIY